MSFSFFACEELTTKCRDLSSLKLQGNFGTHFGVTTEIFKVHKMCMCRSVSSQIVIKDKVADVILQK